MATLPPSKQNVLAWGEKNLTQDFDATFFFFRNSGVESLFCCGEPGKEMFLVEGIFQSRLLTFL